MIYNRNMFLLIIFIIFSSFLSFSTQQSNNTNANDMDYCLQKREGKWPECEGYFKSDEEFCNNIICEPVETCEDNKKLVEKIVGRGCCSACVEFLDEGEGCTPNSRLKKCKNGLSCSLSSHKCELPISAAPKRCTREAHNKKYARDKPTYFYIQAKTKANKIVNYRIRYADDMDIPECNEKGEYLPKQCRNNKCFCVHPETGGFTFGLSVKDSVEGSSENITCECSDHFRQKLMTGRRDRYYMEHYAQIHGKCTGGGNFEKLQCVNATCFCVDEKTGKPDMEKTAIFGALFTLPCFDKEKSEALGQGSMKDSNKYYLEECERQLLKTQELSVHFTDKGTELIGLDKIECSFDGKFAPKQCKPEMCNCVKPDTADIAMPVNYGISRSGNKDSEMNCRCAREVFYATVEKKGYDRLQCDGPGNFKAYQSFDDGLKTYCVDEDGSRIATMVRDACLDQFAKEIDLSLLALREDICASMHRVLTDDIMQPGVIFRFNREDKNYLKVEETEPSVDDTYCNTIEGCEPCK